MFHGWIKDYRKELRSDVWLRNPLYHRVWQFIKYNVCYKEIGQKSGLKEMWNLGKGEYYCKLSDIVRGTGWYNDGIWIEMEIHVIKEILSWMISAEMIDVKYMDSKGNYMVIKIKNWGNYQ